MQSFTFNTPDGLSATRYWAKMGCDGVGNHCGIGGSGGPSEACVHPGSDYSRCAPPIDTKFEASFGQADQPCDPLTNQMTGCDYIDVSLVDGWTLPFKLELDGQCTATNAQGTAVNSIDCSELTFDVCPDAEHLSAA